ncbi:hypothetical protein IE077_000960 [Cardiosporidium cionae]|uniref:Sugar phosphate transporter domain-containing protein n=1 Tax=Cardiosporidium cionae TaxID=476202 RepID=A0ABQ7JDT3_9APIC|nr:hypothetical protein IE077_000960 [Cardiosporidium cionae]|eukprot:KAF8822124.1 hypothetical protein IE077_000960 [Cardiosporidium cionae]
MLRSILKLVLLITPFHIFLSAIWSFLLHPIILVIFCHQLALLQASYLNPFFVTSEVTNTFGISESSLKTAVLLPTCFREAPPVLHPQADLVNSSPSSLISIPTASLSNNESLLRIFANFSFKTYRQTPPTPPPLRDSLLVSRSTNGYYWESTSKYPDSHLLGSPFSIAFYPFSHSTLPPPRYAYRGVGKTVVIGNSFMENLSTKLLQAFGIIHAFGRIIESVSTRSCDDTRSMHPALVSRHPSVMRKQHGSLLRDISSYDSVLFLFDLNRKTRGHSLSESNTHQELIRKSESSPGKIMLWSNNKRNKGRNHNGENKHLVSSLSSEIPRCSKFISPSQHMTESTVSALPSSVGSCLKTSETRKDKLEPNTALEVELPSGVTRPSLSSFNELESIENSGINLKPTVYASPPHLCLANRRSPSQKQFLLIKDTFGPLCMTVGKFSLWYFANCQFSIQNKRALMLFPLPFTVSLLQTAVGIPLAVLPWIFKIRKSPFLHRRGIRTVIEQGFWHTGLHLAGMCALSAGAVSFVSVVKASEPVMTALLRGLVFGKWIQWRSYLSLMPIIVGVILASIKELSFTWSSFSSAMLSNVCSTLRSLKGKEILSNAENIGKNISPQNLFALTHLLSCFMEVPFIAIEIPKWRTFWKAYAMKVKLLGHSPSLIFRHIWLSGLFYFLYNELAMSILNGCNPISHAVANVLKRISVVAVSAFVFGTKISFMSASGSCLAVLGTFIYSLSKSK